MDGNFARLNKIFPNCKYVQIRKYDEEFWAGKEYDSNLDNKAPLTQWRTNPLDFEQASRLVERGFRVGWIVPEGYVVVDVDNTDNPESSACIERILTNLGVRYNYCRTHRGVHFIFQDSMMSCGTDAETKCALGITVDHRANGKGYIILPCNDPHRSWGDIHEEIDDIPSYLRPIMTVKSLKNPPCFIGMNVGEGRNDALYKWRTQLLKSNKLDDEQIVKALKLINEYLFLSPMSDEEMKNTVLKKRDTDAEIREQGKKVKLNALEKENIYNIIANRIVRENDIMCVGYKQFYKFENSYYKPMREIDIERMIHYDISQNIEAKGRREIISYLGVKTVISPEELDRVWNKIAVANGVLDIVTGELYEPNKEEKNTIAIPWAYNPDPPHSPVIDEFMTHISANRDGSPNVMKQQFLYQIAGYCLLKRNYFGKFFIFQGEGGTGKSTFQDLIVKMVGETNRARVGIDKMDNDYYLATLLSKLVNIDDDAVDGKILEQTGRFKSLVSGNEITVRQIFKEPITFTPFATCMFSCNKLPRIQDKTSGLYRRLVIIELNNKVESPDPLFIMKLTKRDMEYFLYKAVYWVGVALKEGKFRISQSEQELLRKFKCRQSSLNEWLYEESMTLADIYNKGVVALYEIYVDWAQRNGYNKLPSVLTFKEDICALYGVEIDYVGDEHRAMQQIFTRVKEPTPKEMQEVPF